MKLKKRKISKVWKEVLDTIEAFKDNPDYAPDPDHVQIYITTKDGGIVELHIGSVSYTHLTLPTNREV